MSQKAVLLCNLGSPLSPEPKYVRRYLRQFLMDGFVIDIPRLPRWLLVHLIIAPFRSYASAEAYQSIWSEKGSPLIQHTRLLTEKLQSELEGWQVAYAMRYGEPSMESVLQSLVEKGVQQIDLIPLYPQYAKSSTGTVLYEAQQVLQALGYKGQVQSVRDFFQSTPFIEAYAKNLRDDVQEFQPEKTLFSFHGLPERHVKQTDKTGQHCLEKKDCCAQIQEVNRYCYRAQCFATARSLARHIQLPEENYRVCFQSRLGKQPWIQPYTDHVITELAEKGVKRILVACPSFVADCLETLEEIAIRAKEQFIEEGGEDLKMVASLNSSRPWVKALSEMLEGEQFDFHPLGEIAPKEEGLAL